MTRFGFLRSTRSATCSMYFKPPAASRMEAHVTTAKMINMTEKATLHVEGQAPIELPIMDGTLGTPVIDVRKLGANGYFTFVFQLKTWMWLS